MSSHSRKRDETSRCIVDAHGGGRFAPLHAGVEPARRRIQHCRDVVGRRLGVEQRTLPRAKTELRQGDDRYQRYYTAFSQRIADYSGRVVDEFGYSYM